ncbi:MAG: hypothetical protein C0485_07980 [Pirellula sp.]|nr:hypothetical protein [Pirellula sp.]
MHFAFLWSLMESKVFGRHAHAAKIVDKVAEWHQANRLADRPWDESLHHFQSRYVNAGRVNETFRKLKFRQNDRENYVADVLTSKREGNCDVVTALLLIVWRLRNNLFHGEKWADPLQRQLQNFQHANSLIAMAIDAHDGRAHSW